MGVWGFAFFWGSLKVWGFGSLGFRILGFKAQGLACGGALGWALLSSGLHIGFRVVGCRHSEVKGWA